jgi:hypothetical protein
MAKKILLKSRPDPVLYTMAGISCHLVDYRFLHMLNKELGFNFSKEEDLQVHLQAQEEAASFSLYVFKDEDQRNSYYLIANFSHDRVLIPEYRQTDFIMLIEGDFNKQRMDPLLKAIRSIPNVLTAYEIKIGDLKNPETFLTDLEMHITRIRKERKEKSKLLNQL